MSGRMGRALRGWGGVLRSVRIYHGSRRHIDGLTALYRPLVAPGDLAFDVGAHVGDRTRVLAALGARVVAVEPQPRLARLLRFAFRNSRRVTVVEAAVAAVPGRLTLEVNTANPTVSTGSRALVVAADAHAMWRGQRWDDKVEVEAVTLDGLVARFGTPGFVKVDVEGLEDEVLAGLSRPVRTLSFEVTTLQRAVGLDALARAEALGYGAYNLSLGESHRFLFDAPVDAARIGAEIAGLTDAANSGDVYAFGEPLRRRTGML